MINWKKVIRSAIRIKEQIYETHQSYFDSIGMGGLRDEAFNGIMMLGNPGHIKRKLF